MNIWTVLILVFISYISGGIGILIMYQNEIKKLHRIRMEAKNLLIELKEVLGNEKEGL